MDKHAPDKHTQNTQERARQTRIASNLALITRQIDAATERYQAKAGITGHKVTLVAVSKYQDVESMRALYLAGQRAFGENRVQDLRQKASELERLLAQPPYQVTLKPQAPQTPIEWHFIGTLQRNKINHLLALSPTLIHSIDSIELALSLDERCKAQGRIQPALLQVNAANEPSKHGFSLESTCDAFAHIRARTSHLRLQGLMTIGAHTQDISAVVESFARTKALYDTLRAAYSDVETLSMGMSGDFMHAIEQGANMVRIGSALFRF